MFCDAVDTHCENEPLLRQILKSNVAGNIAELANNGQLPRGSRGQAMRIANAIEGTPLAREIVLKSGAKSSWEEFSNSALSRFNLESQVSELQRKTKYDTMGASDRFEDRI